MDAKLKAKELVEKFRFGKPILYLEREADEIEFAKQCALIAVDEILNELSDELYYDSNFKYWQQVKQQIEKL